MRSTLGTAAATRLINQRRARKKASGSVLVISISWDRLINADGARLPSEGLPPHLSASMPRWLVFLLLPWLRPLRGCSSTAAHDEKQLACW